MYIRHRDSKGHRYYAIVAGQRCANEVKQKNTKNIGRLDNLTTEELWSKIAIVDEFADNKMSKKIREILFTLGYSVHDLISIHRSLHYGDVAAFYRIAELLDLPRIISRITGKGGGPDAGKIITIMAICQALAPTSKNDLRNWYEETALEYITGIKAQDVEEWVLYSCMRYLTKERIERIEAEIVRVLVEEYDIKLDTWLYDLTSIYLYARMDDQKKRGYSRDHMKHLVQIILAIAVTKEHGFPIMHWVYPGNTTDVTTLPTAAEDLKAQYKEHTAILVYDRGNLSEKNVRILDGMNYDYICGLKRGIKAVRELIEAAKDYGKFELVKVLDDREGYQFAYGTVVEAELWGKKRKVIICYSEGLRETKHATRTRKLEKASKALETLQQKAQNRKYPHDDLNIAIHECTKGVKRYFDTIITDHPGRTVLSFEKKDSAKEADGRRIRGIDSKLSRLQESAGQMSPGDVRVEVKKILKGQKKHYTYRVWEEGAYSTLSFELLMKTVVEMSSLDGFHAMMSTDQSISMEEIIGTYDSRDVVEKSFAMLKHPVRIRPIRHWVPAMVRAHVYICILGYLMRQFLLFLLHRAGLSKPLSSALVDLRRVKVIQIGGTSEDGSDVLRMTHLSDSQKQLFSIIDVDYLEIIRTGKTL